MVLVVNKKKPVLSPTVQEQPKKQYVQRVTQMINAVVNFNPPPIQKKA
jgi:hypothetical protein